MDSKSVILAVLKGKRSPRLPKAVFGSGLWAYKQTGMNRERMAREPGRFVEVLSEFYRNLDTDIVFLGSGLNSFPAEAVGGVLNFEGDRAPLLAEPIVRTWEDLKRMENIDLARSPYAQSLIQVVEGIRRELPDRFIAATSWGPFAWAMILCDWELLKEKLVSDRGFIRGVSELGVRLSAAFYDPLVERNCIDAISIPDGAATLMSVKDYSELVLPLEKSLFNRFREKGIHGIFHMCGEIGPQLHLYPNAEPACVTVDHHVPIERACETFAGKTVTAGNVHVIDSIREGDEKRIRKDTADCVARVPDPFLNYILMPSCDLPVDTPIENVNIFLSCADQTMDRLA
jgi:uroporphyrinogen decarboxylase